MAVLLALDLREQAAFQTTMTIARALIIVLMVGTLLLGERGTAAGPRALLFQSPSPVHARLHIPLTG